MNKDRIIEILTENISSDNLNEVFNQIGDCKNKLRILAIIEALEGTNIFICDRGHVIFDRANNKITAVRGAIVSNINIEDSRFISDSTLALILEMLMTQPNKAKEVLNYGRD